MKCFIPTLKLLIALYILTLSAQAQQTTGTTHWMLLINHLNPPPSYLATVEEFSKQCYQPLQEQFNSTTISVKLLEPETTPDQYPNDKRDIILHTDPMEFHIFGATHDTLIVWMRYRVGFTYTKIMVPYPKKRSADLPQLVAKAAYKTARNDFFGEVQFTGGPTGLKLHISNDIEVSVPTRFLIPPGSYGIRAERPQFKTIMDSIDIYPGKLFTKRILLLPE